MSARLLALDPVPCRPGNRLPASAAGVARGRPCAAAEVVSGGAR